MRRDAAVGAWIVKVGEIETIRVFAKIWPIPQARCGRRAALIKGKLKSIFSE